MGAKDTPQKRAYIAAYQKENTRNVSFRLSKIYDEDVIAFMDALPNKSQWLKGIVRAELKKTKENKVKS